MGNIIRKNNITGGKIILTKKNTKIIKIEHNNKLKKYKNILIKNNKIYNIENKTIFFEKRKI